MVDITGATLRRFTDYMDFNTPADYGAFTSGGVTDNQTVINSAAANGRVFVPNGVFKYGTDDSGGSVAGKAFWGPGIVQTGANRRARSMGYLNAAPAFFGDTGSVVTGFNGDFSKSVGVNEFRVTGSSTLGTPSSGYYQKHETSAIYSRGYMGSTAGQNAATDWTDGRTGWSFRFDQMDHFGQGDLTAHTMSVNIWNNKSGGTHFLAQPAGNCMGGGVVSWVNNVNAVIGEFYVDGQSYDINGTGFALHFVRNNATGAGEAQWRGISIISSGTQAIDMAYVARGKINRGFDIGNADLGANQAAIAMSADQRIYGAVTYNNTSSANPLASGYKVFGAYNTAWFRYGSSTTKWDFNNSVNLITGNAYHINNVQVLGARDTGWTAMTGTANKNTVYDVSTVTLPQLAARVAALQAALTTHGSIGT